MQATKKTILGEQSIERRTKVILAHMKKPDGLAVVDLLHELNLTEKDRSGIVDHHIAPLLEFGVLEECPTIPEHGKQKKKRKLDGHLLKKDLQALQEIINAFDNNLEVEDEIIRSQYWGATAPVIARLINESIQRTGLRRFDIYCAGEPSEEIERSEKKHHQRMESPDMQIRNCAIKMLEPLRTFNDDAMNEINAALKSNWLMLKFAVHYLSIDDEKKKECLLRVIADARSNTIAAAKLEGIRAMRRSIMDEVSDILLSTPEDKDKAFFVAEILARATENAEKDLFGSRAAIWHIWFCDFFNHLKDLRDQYLLPPN